MKKFALVITRQNIPEFIESHILLPIVRKEFGEDITSIFFVEDGVYHLMKATRSAKHIRAIIEKQQVRIFACEDSIISRNLQNLIIDGITLGKLKDFLEASENADRILTF